MINEDQADIQHPPPGTGSTIFNNRSIYVIRHVVSQKWSAAGLAIVVLFILLALCS